MFQRNESKITKFFKSIQLELSAFYHDVKQALKNIPSKIDASLDVLQRHYEPGLPNEKKVFIFTLYALGISVIFILPLVLAKVQLIMYSLMLGFQLACIIGYNVMGLSLGLVSGPDTRSAKSNINYALSSFLLQYVSTLFLPIRVATTIIFVTSMAYTHSIFKQFMNMDKTSRRHGMPVIEVFNAGIKQANSDVHLSKVEVALLMKHKPTDTLRSDLVEPVEEFFKLPKTAFSK